MLNLTNTAFCTYFDKNYLPKGLSMLNSFCAYNPDGKIYVLCFDDFTHKFISTLSSKQIIPLSLKQFEDKDLLKAKNTRSIVEYYWTCTPSLPLYIIKKYPHYEAVTYLDADLNFYSSINNVLSELGEKSIYTVEHRYPKGQEGRESTSGRFNVAFQIFRNDDEGIACLNRWRKQCLDWCYWKEEDGKMGDQMYLNEWPKLYKKLVISQNLGVDTAPWNVSQYKVSARAGKIFVNEFPLICYHFHQLRIEDKNHFEYASGYHFSKNVLKYIYDPYAKTLTKTIEYIMELIPEYAIPNNRTPITIQIKNHLASIIGPIYWRLLKKHD